MLRGVIKVKLIQEGAVIGGSPELHWYLGKEHGGVSADLYVLPAAVTVKDAGALQATSEANEMHARSTGLLLLSLLF